MLHTLYQSKLLTRTFLLYSLCLLQACDYSPKAKKTWPLASEGIFSAAFAGRHALFGSVNGIAYLWVLGKKAPKYSWQHGKDNPEGMVAVAISDNEKYALTAQRNSLAWWRIKDGKLLKSWGFDFIKSLSLSKDGQFALIGLADQAVYFTLKYGKTIYAFKHDSGISATALSNDLRYALTGADNASVILWNLKNGKKVHTWQHTTKISSLALDPKNRYAMTNEALGKTQIWSIKSGKLKRTLGPKLMTVSSATFSPNGKYLATGRTSQRIDLWKIKTGKNIKHWTPKKSETWRPSASTILALEFLPTGKKLLSASSNGYAQLWKTR